MKEDTLKNRVYKVSDSFKAHRRKQIITHVALISIGLLAVAAYVCFVVSVFN